MNTIQLHKMCYTKCVLFLSTNKWGSLVYVGGIIMSIFLCFFDTRMDHVD
jgi:hypothetical protein